jgi:DNA-binding transcriptional MerR regulator
MNGTLQQTDGLRIGEVSERLDMHEKNHSTLRLWISTFGSYLSPAARGGSGRERRFSDVDLATLLLIRRLRSEGHGFEAIAEVLDRQMGRAPAAACSCQSESSAVAVTPAPVSGNQVSPIAEAELQRLRAELATAREELTQTRSELDELSAWAVGQVDKMRVARSKGISPEQLGLENDGQVPETTCAECAALSVYEGHSTTGRRFWSCTSCGWVKALGLSSKSGKAGKVSLSGTMLL